MDITIIPIGKIKVQEKRGLYALEVFEEYREGLRGLEEFGMVQVFWWAHLNDTPQARSRLSCELPYALDTRAGVFACRAEYRPNLIGLTACPIREVRQAEGLVILDYIDALDGTPLLDLKPYIPCCDRAKGGRQPAWFQGWPEWIEDAGAFFSSPQAPRTGRS